MNFIEEKLNECAIYFESSQNMKRLGGFYVYYYVRVKDYSDQKFRECISDLFFLSGCKMHSIFIVNNHVRILVFFDKWDNEAKNTCEKN